MTMTETDYQRFRASLQKQVETSREVVRTKCERILKDPRRELEFFSSFIRHAAIIDVLGEVLAVTPPLGESADATMKRIADYAEETVFRLAYSGPAQSSNALDAHLAGETLRCWEDVRRTLRNGYF